MLFDAQRSGTEGGKCTQNVIFGMLLFNFLNKEESGRKFIHMLLTHKHEEKQNDDEEAEY